MTWMTVNYFGWMKQKMRGLLTLMMVSYFDLLMQKMRD